MQIMVQPIDYGAARKAIWLVRPDWITCCLVGLLAVGAVCWVASHRELYMWGHKTSDGFLTFAMGAGTVVVDKALTTSTAGSGNLQTSASWHLLGCEYSEWLSMRSSGLGVPAGWRAVVPTWTLVPVLGGPLLIRCILLARRRSRKKVERSVGGRSKTEV